jgi:hypothetical protein
LYATRLENHTVYCVCISRRLAYPHYGFVRVRPALAAAKPLCQSGFLLHMYTGHQRLSAIIRVYMRGDVLSGRHWPQAPGSAGERAMTATRNRDLQKCTVQDRHPETTLSSSEPRNSTAFQDDLVCHMTRRLGGRANRQPETALDTLFGRPTHRESTKHLSLPKLLGVIPGTWAVERSGNVLCVRSSC